jgi:hypothetical protein
VRTQGAPRRLPDVERFEGDGADLGAALGLVERGILEDLHHAVGERAELLGGSAGPGGGGGERQEQEERRREPAGQAMTLIRA